MSTRRIIATYAFVMFFLVIALLGTVTAAFGGTSYTEAAGRQSLYTLTAAKARGTIYDRNLQPLTNAERVYVAAVIPSRETLAKLNRAVPEEKREVLRTALESGKPFLIEVTTPVSADGIQTFSVTKRSQNGMQTRNRRRICSGISTATITVRTVWKKASTHCLRKTMGKSTLPSPLMRSAMPSPAKQCTWKTHTALRTVA